MSNGINFDDHLDALIAEIAAAFDGVSRGDGTTLHEAFAMDDYLSYEEQQAARRLDTDKRWQDVPDDDIRACYSALSFVDVEGFRYYLPAFMTYGLRHWHDSADDSSILSSCEFHLSRESGKSLRQSEPASIAGKYRFTDAQCSAIAKFLRFVGGDMAVAQRQAVERWEKYAQGLSSNNY